MTQSHSRLSNSGLKSGNQVIFGIFFFQHNHAVLAYWVAEMCELSAILAIVFCAFTMRYYLDKNLDEHTLISLEKVIKSLAHTMEMTIFMILGLYAGQAEWKEHMDWELSLISLALCTIFRPIISCSLTAILNRYRTKKISTKDQMIMSLSGLRGGIAFFLIVLSNMNEVDGYPEGAKETFILATTFIVFFTGRFFTFGYFDYTLILSVKPTNVYWLSLQHWLSLQKKTIFFLQGIFHF